MKWVSSGEPSFTIGPDIPQWGPNLAKKFRQAHIELKNSALDALIDDTSKSTKVVYLSWWD